MINKKVAQNTITALEDVKGLYTQLIQSATEESQRQKLQSMMDETEKQYHSLNSML